MSREGRSQPIQPFAAHGFLGNVPPNGTLPAPVVVVENDDRRRRPLPLQPTVGASAYLAVLPTATVFPQAPVSVEVDQRRLRSPLLQPIVQHGGLDNGVGVPGTAPPKSFVVPLDERKRFLAALPPVSTAGFDDVAPPDPTVVEPDSRTRRIKLPETVFLVGPALDTTQQATPPAPVVVFVDGARRILLPQSTIQHGFVDPGPGPVGTTPPPVNVTPLVERRMFFVALPPMVYKPFVEPVVTPTTTNVNQDFASIVGGW